METITLTKEMFNSGKPFAQGELRMWLKEYAPKEILNDCRKMTVTSPEDGRLIVAHSETGHHHCIDVIERDNEIGANAQRLISQTNEFIAMLNIKEESLLKHHRVNDNHKAYLLPVGDYVVRIDQEYTPEGYRAVMD